VPRLTVSELVRGAQGALLGGRLDAVLGGVSIDSRTAAPGDVFFAIRGAHQDGHAFVGNARARGASAAVVTRLPAGIAAGPDFAVVVVDDTTRALQRLAAAHRQRFTLPVVAITGSNGKTTTKELAALVLAERWGARWQVLKPVGSFNNQWGLPLTLLALGPEHGALVVELGMNAPGEIAALARLARPGVGVVTSVSAAHLEGVGSLEGVQQAKGELVEAIPADGVVVLNGDDPLVAALAERARGRVVRYGLAPGADLQLEVVRTRADGVDFTLRHQDAAVDVQLPLPGRHNAWNAAAAVLVGLVLGVPLAAAPRALAAARPVKGRLVWREAGGVRLLDDTYNANPTSMRAALEVLREAGARGGQAWVLLGDMLELGGQTEAAHRQVGAWVAGERPGGFAATGPAMRLAAEAARAAGCAGVATFDAPEDAARHLAERIRPGDRVLVKGSRGMRMERAVDALLAQLGGAAPARSAAC
jgi:UDP-N-acetylmuramoyl-tripeptide--D-alanyl-D-alanine ligase